LFASGVGRFDVQCVKSLAEAQTAISKGGMDVILLDLGLPDSIGLETFDKLHSTVPEIPVIVFSGLADDRVAIEALRKGAQDYLVKGQGDSELLTRTIRYAVERQRVELALEYERNLFRSLMENIPDAVYFKDCESRFLRISNSQARQFKFASPAEAVGKTDFDVFTEEHARPAFEDEQEIIRTGAPMVGKIERETHQDGALTWALTTKMPLRDGRGRIIGTFGISKDITEIKVMEEVLESERNLLQALINALPDHIYVKDTASRFILCNTAVAKFFGIGSTDDIVGKSDADFFRKKWCGSFVRRSRSCLMGRRRR